ncbi:chorismate mutase [Bacillus timonensis]|nr:chorismate mutase [Bacillus timonensis]
MIRGIRGAITVEQNNEKEILDSTEILLREMIAANQIEAEHVVQVLISVTEDINATFPAKALREINGWDYVPVMCMKEISVPNSLAKCIRVMITVNSSEDQEKIKHVYLKNASTLRPDLSLTNKK